MMKNVILAIASFFVCVIDKFFAFLRCINLFLVQHDQSIPFVCAYHVFRSLRVLSERQMNGITAII